MHFHLFFLFYCNSNMFRISGNQMPNNGYNTNDMQLPSYNLLIPQQPFFERVNSEPPKYDDFIKNLPSNNQNLPAQN